jgi:hypothetical protein
MGAQDRISKKPSDANSPSKPPEFPAVFLDRSLGKHTIAGALRQAGIEVIVHDDQFPQDTKDEDWLAWVGERGHLVFTKDSRIRYRTTERTALLRAGVAAFVLVARGDLRGEDMAEIYVKALPRVSRLLSKHKRPFIAKIGGDSSVSLLYPHA